MNIAIRNPSALVSVYISVKNSILSIERCINSVISQSYSNVEVIVQDGASTDGTLEILTKYIDHIQLISEPDSGPGEALVKALKRCRGEYIIACLSDEELLPGAINWAVKQFNKNPTIAVIYGDILTTDISGNIINASNSKKWNYKKVLCSVYFPYFCASFFRREYIDKVGIPADSDATEFGLWWRIGQYYEIKYVPHLVAKFALHDNQLSENVHRYSVHLPARLDEIKNIVDHPNCTKKLQKLRQRAIAGCFLFNVERLLVRQAETMDIAYHQFISAQKYKPDLIRLAKLSLVFRKLAFRNRNQLTGLSKIVFMLLENTHILISSIQDMGAYMNIYSITSIAMFGAWPGARPLVNKYEKWNIKVNCFVDNSKAKQGKKYLNRPVYAVDYLLTDDAKQIQAIIITSEESRKKMIGQLKKIGFNKKII